jgi:hypothetical protein
MREDMPDQGLRVRRTARGSRTLGVLLDGFGHDAGLLLHLGPPRRQISASFSSRDLKPIRPI